MGSMPFAARARGKKDLAVLQTRDENMHSIPPPLRMLGRSVIDGSSRVPYWNWQGYLRIRGTLAHHGMFFKRYGMECQDEGAAMHEIELMRQDVVTS